MHLSSTRADELAREVEGPLALRYRRPDFALQTLWNEVVTRWGVRAYNKGLFAGQEPELFGCDAHNIDAHGICHALDLGIDLKGTGVGLSRADGDWLAEHLRSVGAQSQRFAYLIYGGRIVGQFSAWQWVEYFGVNTAQDRIHLSICDQPWGAPAPVSPEIYDSITPWGLS